MRLIYKRTEKVCVSLLDEVSACEVKRAAVGAGRVREANELRGESRFAWMDAEYLQGCERGRLKASEERFWDQLIDTYLKV